MAGRHTDMTQHINKIYNHLKVIDLDVEIYEYKDKKLKSTHFICECICGNFKRIFGGNVLSGMIKSCGCKKKELIAKATYNFYKNNNNLSVQKKMFSSYKKHGKIFQLTFDEFCNIIIKDCYYCGKQPNRYRFSKNKKLSLKLNGIDRINSNLGYLSSNIVPCCTTCNIMKNAMTQDEFITHIKEIINNLKK